MKKMIFLTFSILSKKNKKIEILFYFKDKCMNRKYKTKKL